MRRAAKIAVVGGAVSTRSGVAKPVTTGPPSPQGYAGQRSTWACDSSPPVARGADGGAVVKWTPSEPTGRSHRGFGRAFQGTCAPCSTFKVTVRVLPDGAVANEARQVFGLGLNWSTGVPSSYGSAPTTGGASKAMTYIGLSAPADAALRSLLKSTAQQGTSAPTVRGLSGDVGAKTGTAEVDGRPKPDNWFIAYRDDVAAAAVVPDSGEGYSFAGKIVTAVLAAS
ncbi:penicillin-binding transpeptidase domain-containing protein [Streptomyces sp. TRM68367]|uniref:penicillin-binding transpeptidase domain-containing protein n=1 Tax=Streptomyces sp. TRM68367 TaxID=2758415 RepID=UPI002934A44E|nr:penicillin-binding transpeptidase domain-containing protein [Streptomyces sp. TRM68367]